MTHYLERMSEDTLSALFLTGLPLEKIPAQVNDRVLQRVICAVKGLSHLNSTGAPAVLIVDNKDLFRHSLTRALEEAGYQVFGAANGRDALRLCTTQAIHIALLDAKLPDMAGYGLCMKLREERDVPVIIMSDLHNADEMLQGFAAGASAFVCKPFPFRELSAQIRQTLHGGH